MALAVVHSPLFATELSPGNRFPMPKPPAIADALVAQGIVARDGFHVPVPAAAEWVALAHSRSYVDQVFSASVPDAISRMIGFKVNKVVATRARCASAGTILAGQLALQYGIATSTAGGSHHAKRDHGAGFCVFNDCAVAARFLLQSGAIETALIFDCDVHQGDGTAQIFANDPRVKTVSLHAEKNFPARKENSDIDVALPDGMQDTAYCQVLKQALEASFELCRPDLVFFNAGVDPHGDDSLGRLGLSDAGLEERDKLVIGRFREAGIAVAAVMGGGYGNDLNAITSRHCITHRVASSFSS